MKKRAFLKLPELTLVVFVLVSSLMLGFSSGGFIINVKMVGFSCLSAMQMGINTVTSKATAVFTSVRDMARLQEEYNALTEKLKDYEYLRRSNAEIRKENERLREQLGLLQSVTYRNIAAQIIGRDADNIYSGITIDKGAMSGIRKNMPVIAIQNGSVGIVGKVVTVGLTTSMIMPLYDSSCNISARILNTRDQGLVSGNGSIDAPLSLGYIRKRVLKDIHYGDIVVTSGENGNYMRDIPIGTITKITVLDYDSSLEIEMEPIIDFSRLEMVFVVDQSAQNEVAIPQAVKLDASGDKK
ncbi:MAG: rod shape-determining protein MreC [Treponema sp.]|nr:rod shape-determining protein MreC [Treponema sp.]